MNKLTESQLERVQKIINHGVDVCITVHNLGVFSTIQSGMTIKEGTLKIDLAQSIDEIEAAISNKEKSIIAAGNLQKERISAIENVSCLRKNKSVIAGGLNHTLISTTHAKKENQFDSCKKILGDSFGCTILAQHKRVIIIDCEDVTSTGSDEVWYKNEKIN